MKLQLKRSNVLESGSAKQPTAAQLEYGELAINYNKDDPAIFLKDSNNNVIRISGADNIADDGTTEVPAGTTPPLNPEPGNLWFNSAEGRLYIYYKDVDTEQWVDASPDSYDPAVIPDMTDPNYQPGTLDDRYNSSQVGEFPPDVNLRNEGALWWNSQNDEGKLYVLYNDPAPDGRKKWVEASPHPDVSGFISTNDDGDQQEIIGGGGLTVEGNLITGDYPSGSGTVSASTGVVNIRRDAAGDAFGIYSGGIELADRVVNIQSDGSATFASTISQNASLYDVNTAGNVLYANGGLSVITDSDPIWRGYTTGNSTATSVIYPSGSASFKNEVSVDRPESSSNSGFRVFGDGAVKSTLFTDGSASFAGDVTSATNVLVGGNALSGSATGTRIRAGGDIQLSASAGGNALLQGYTTGNSTPTVDIKANGSSTFGSNTGQKINIRPGQTGNGDAFWLEDTDTNRPFLVTADGSATFAGGSASISNNGWVQTNDTFTSNRTDGSALVLSGKLNGNPTSSIKADGSATFASAKADGMVLATTSYATPAGQWGLSNVAASGQNNWLLFHGDYNAATGTGAYIHFRPTYRNKGEGAGMYFGGVARSATVTELVIGNVQANAGDANAVLTEAIVFKNNGSATFDGNIEVLGVRIDRRYENSGLYYNTFGNPPSATYTVARGIEFYTGQGGGAASVMAMRINPDGTSAFSSTVRIAAEDGTDIDVRERLVAARQTFEDLKTAVDGAADFAALKSALQTALADY